MTPKFDDSRDSKQQEARELDSLQRSRFEMLSAYLDGEVTADERYQVQQWLASDCQVKYQYRRLMKLRQGMQTLPVPQLEQSAIQIAQKVWVRLEQLRNRRIIGWSGAAIATLLIGALSSALPGGQSSVPQLAKISRPASHETLMVALNAPPVMIPKPMVASTDKFLQKSAVRSH